ncbi:MAG: tRNA threonylcarbamoyladenosine dehydratase [Ruminococcaceae bacterium]|nr:tRNA threonylcarbamoyladenosine dehydratase [Oscillospiraceae bacterium]
MEQFFRTEILVGQENMKKINNTRVLVFGVGGVGSYTVMALARSGVSSIDIVDSDTVSVTNINRQIIANLKSVGRKKVEVLKEMLLDINKDIKVNTFDLFVNKDNIDTFDFSSYDFVVDAIDTVSSKILIIEKCNESNTKIISAMGAGNKFDATKFEVTDIYKTSVCPLAKVMRYELKKRGIKKLKVVYSKETPAKPLVNISEDNRRSTPGSMAYVPSVSGLIIAGEIINHITGINKTF